MRERPSDAPDHITQGWQTPPEANAILRRTEKMKRAALALVAFLLAPMPTVRAADVTIVKAFPADKGPGYRKPAPDVAGAVGPHHAVVLDDRAFVAVEKATGKVVRDLTQHDFWLGVQPVQTLDLQANDPRILYDPLSGRWIAWVQGVDPMNGLPQPLARRGP